MEAQLCIEVPPDTPPGINVPASALSLEWTLGLVVEMANWEDTLTAGMV